MSNNILVLGSTGKTGRRVSERLRQRQIPIRLGSRTGQPAFNWDDPYNWQEVLTDIETVYITFQPDIGLPEAKDKIDCFVETAKAANVKKLVLLSGRGEPEAQACEQVVMKSGLEWTIIRASWFMQNFSESFLLESILTNEVVLPVINALEPFLDVDDIADVAVAALTDKKHSQKIYELTGPELLSHESVTAQIAAALDRKISYAEIPMDEYVAVLKSLHLPDEFISMIRHLFIETLDGRNETVTKDVENVLGRKATTFNEYISKTLTTRIWKAQ